MSYLELVSCLVDAASSNPITDAEEIVLAYDLSAAALGNTTGTGEALLSAGYAAYAVAFAAMAAQVKDPAEKKRMIAKAAQHSSDAVTHAWEALPGRMDRGDDGEWRLREHPERLPLTYTLQAVRPR